MPVGYASVAKINEAAKTLVLMKVNNRVPSLSFSSSCIHHVIGILVYCVYMLFVIYSEFYRNSI